MEIHQYYSVGLENSLESISLAGLFIPPLVFINCGNTSACYYVVCV